MDVYVSIDKNGVLSISVDGVEKSDLHDTIRELVYTALSTRKKLKGKEKDNIAFEGLI
ncbi:MAG: hypothetical protein IJI57_04800 [Flexilinea sp.]|nr:hypothetical protein [Flexilinea sp.]